MKKFLIIISACLVMFPIITSPAFALSIEILPSTPMQGDPLIINIIGEQITINEVAKIEFNKKALWFFTNQGTPTAFYGIDLNQKPGLYEIAVKMEDGQTHKKTVEIMARKKYETSLPIPEKLGGNTPSSATKLVSNLAKENEIINRIFSTNKKYWKGNFSYPLDRNEISDEYGYGRNTVQYTIPHKGVDFKADDGTPVYAINSGVVRLARSLPTYGNTVAIDHGLGLVSYYMHLSKLNVKNGQWVERRQNIGLSGSTGYATGAHLHLSIKIYGVSIDPTVFLRQLAR